MAITLGLFKIGSKEPMDTVCISSEDQIPYFKEYLLQVNMIDENDPKYAVYRKLPVSLS